MIQLLSIFSRPRRLIFLILHELQRIAPGHQSFHLIRRIRILNLLSLPPRKHLRRQLIDRRSMQTVLNLPACLQICEMFHLFGLPLLNFNSEGLLANGRVRAMRVSAIDRVIFLVTPDLAGDSLHAYSNWLRVRKTWLTEWDFDLVRRLLLRLPMRQQWTLHADLVCFE